MIQLRSPEKVRTHDNTIHWGGYKARILADSLGPFGNRLLTYELTYPRFVHSEFMTHRLFSRNAASSRAIPVQKMIDAVMHNPAMPVWWGKAQKGMQANEEVSDEMKLIAMEEWLAARDSAVRHMDVLLNTCNLHKQIPNRIAEPWMWITVLCTSTHYGNWFNLRCDPDAQPEIQRIAEMMAELYYTCEPKELGMGEWHTPLILPDEADMPIEIKKKVSTGRCARVSYLTHDGVRDIAKDIQLHDQLIAAGHMSPTEHVAMVQTNSLPYWSGNFYGFTQYRKTLAGEHRERYDWKTKAKGHLYESIKWFWINRSPRPVESLTNPTVQ